MTDPVSLFAQLIAQAQDDPQVLGLVLVGSRGREMAGPDSDFDAYLVVQDGAAEAASQRYAAQFGEAAWLDLGILDLAAFQAYAAWGSPEAWERYTFSHAQALVDKTGALEALVVEKGRLPPGEQHAFLWSALDAAINGVYRTAKCWRRGERLGARLEAAEALGHMLALVFGLEGRHRPYPGYLARELHRFPLQHCPLGSQALLEDVERILDRADLSTLQSWLGMLEPLCAQAGLAEVFESWGEDYPWLMHYHPEDPRS